MPINQKLSPTARRFSKALLDRFPQFRRTLRVLPGGDFEAAIAAPRSSKAGALVCASRGSDVWVRFAPPRAFYSIDTPSELVTIVEALLNDDVLFVLLSKQRKWSGTTLVARTGRPVQDVGESARIISWSGKRDRRVRAPNTKHAGAPSTTRLHPPGQR